MISATLFSISDSFRAALALLLSPMALRQPHRWALRAHQLGLFLHDLARNVDDGFGYVEFMFGADFEPMNVILLQKLNLFFWDFSCFSPVALVDEAKDAVFRRILLRFLDPVGHHILESFGDCDVIDQYDCVGALVVGLGNASEPLLPCCVPDLQLHEIFVNVHGPA